MPSKKKSGTSKGSQLSGLSKKPELKFEPVVYVTNKVSTMIDMLDSPEPKILLRLVGTLNKLATCNEGNLDFMLSCSIYEKLMEVLNSSEIYTLRFTLSLIEKIATQSDFIQRVDLSHLYATAKMIKEHYSTLKDDIIRRLSVSILLNVSKYNSMIAQHIYSIEFVAKIFEILKSEKELQLALDNIELLFYVLDSSKAESELLQSNNFDIQYLLCLFGLTSCEFMRYWAVHILHKIAMWKNGEVLRILANAKVIESMMRLILSELDYSDLCFEAIYACISEDECAGIFVKTLEFVEFVEWVKVCPKVLAGHSSLIIKSLTEREDLLQVLFDFSTEESAISLFRHINESVILNVCDIIMHMMRHKYCMESMARPSLMRIFTEIMYDDQSFPILPYGEQALKTLHRFFECCVRTPKLVYDGDSINMLTDVFAKSKTKMTCESYVRMIEIIQYLVKSEFAHALMDIGTIQLIIELYFESTFEEDKILTIMESFLENDEFREIFLERNGIGVMLEKIRTRKSIECSTQTLLALKRLITYKRIGAAFIDHGYIADLKYLKENLWFPTPLIDEIIETVYDLCLTLKFFYTHKLGENDKIRDQFMLIPSSIISKHLSSFNVQSMKISDRVPIYVVYLHDVLATEKEEHAKSIMDIREIDAQSLFAGSRRIAHFEDELNPFYRLTAALQRDFHPSEISNGAGKQQDLFDEDMSLTKVISFIIVILLVSVWGSHQELRP